MAVPTLEEIVSESYGRENAPSYDMYVKATEMHNHLTESGCFAAWSSRSGVKESAIRSACFTGFTGAFLLHIFGFSIHWDWSFICAAIALGISCYMGIRRGKQDCSNCIAHELPEALMKVYLARRRG